ncbi:MAG TPA: bifunctional DNA-formamidopyrimidine glycosylase/DNA-(apurinic or apyrimidinic site) lyase [Acidimicrobiales bacterium]|nr:bifunctional DNA-formamidopyrimidine glycosylase/DNA-(apurinic or apyrimidinic site) lyase [Acidimicrobiales bacterium]
MPELPEVETVRRQLEERVLGERIISVSVTGRRTIRRQPKEEFSARLASRTIVAARRWGKFLLVDLDGGEVLVIHLRMSGQLRLEEDPDNAPSAHTHVRLGLSSSRELRFVDPRTFGELFVADDLDGRGLPREIAHLGCDPIVEELSGEALGRLCAHRRIALKTLLLDQRIVAGIGNIYGDEICHQARVRPTRPAGTLTKKEYSRVAAATRAILEQAICEQGSTLGDQRYRDLVGGLGTFQDHHEVYGRAGHACHRCGTTIRRQILAGRSAHYCPRCQR